MCAILINKCHIEEKCSVIIIYKKCINVQDSGILRWHCPDQLFRIQRFRVAFYVDHRLQGRWGILTSHVPLAASWLLLLHILLLSLLMACCKLFMNWSISIPLGVTIVDFLLQKNNKEIFFGMICDMFPFFSLKK